MVGTPMDGLRTPWVPSVVRLRPVKRGTTTSRTSGGRPGRERPCWDVVWTVDGQRFFRRFDKAAEADAFVVELHGGHSNRLPLDPLAKCFVDPRTREPVLGKVAEQDQGELNDDAVVESELPAVVTVAQWTERYWAWSGRASSPRDAQSCLAI